MKQRSKPHAAAPLIRAAADADVAELARLFGTCFEKPIIPAHWRWKLNHWPSPAPNSWVAERDGQLIGHYGGIPLPFRIEGREQIGMIAVHAMVAPTHRRDGVLTALVRHAHHIWREAGMAFTLALLNQQWGSLRDTLGWESWFCLKWRVRALDPGAVLARKLHLPLKVPLAPLTWLWNQFWDHCFAKEHGAVSLAADSHPGDRDFAPFSVPYSVFRNRAWTRWRYDSAPFDYRLILAGDETQPAGYAAYRLQTSPGRKLGLIAELSADPQQADVWKLLLGQTLHDLHQDRADLAATLAIPGTYYDRLLKRAGFVFSWGSFDVWFAPLAISSHAKLRDPSHWLLTGGDFDVI